MSHLQSAFAGTARFEILRHLGSGGMGSVYEAFDRQSGARIALKTIEHASGSALYQLKQEFRSLADIRHPNLVQLLELISDDERWFFTMELIDGVDFLSYVCSRWIDAGEFDRRVPDLKRLRSSVIQLARGVDALHRAGKVHRDIKPPNVLVTPSGRVFVLDFGLVEDLSGPRADAASIQGTVSYMSPEQAGQQPAVPASDWYAVGVMVYEALTGRLPFEGSPVEILAKKLMATPKAPVDLEPSVASEWNELCLALLANDPLHRPDAAEILQRLGADSSDTEARVADSDRAPGPFVGRREELKGLRTWWEQEAGSSPSVAIISGPSGIGKTALIDHFINELSEDPPPGLPVLALKGRCHERETLPFKAFDAIIDSLSDHLSAFEEPQLRRVIPPDIRYLSGVFPVLERVETIAERRYDRPPIPDPNELRRRAFACLAALLVGLSRERSLLLFVDDFQWADEDSYDLFRSLIDAPSTGGVTFLLSSRPSAAKRGDVESGFAEVVANLVERSSTRLIELAPLSYDDAVDLTNALLPEHDDDAARLVEAVVREAEGSPFFVRELTAHLTRAGPGSRPALTFEAVMAERLDILPDASRALLRLIALAGDAMPQSVLSSAAGLSMASVAWNEALVGLTSAGLIRRQGQRRTDSVEIYHDRIRQAVYAECGFEAEALHAKLARALEAEPRTRAGRLVRHWIGASRPERARTHVRAAIEETRAKLAFGQAVQLYRSALELETAPAARPALFKGLGDSLANVGRPHAAAEAYLLGVTGADRATRLELQNLAAGKLLQGGYITKGVEALRGVLGLVGIKLAAAPAMVLTSLVYQQLRLRLGGLEFRERAVSEIDREELLRLDVLRSASTGFSFVDTIRGADFQVRVLRQALRTGEIGRISEALALHGSYSAGQGGRNLQKGREAVERSFAMAERIGDPRLLAIASGGRGMIAFWAGNWDGTVAHFASGEQRLMNECHGVHWELATARMFLGLGLMRLGEMRRLGDRYDVHVAHASMMGDQFGAASLKTRHNVVWLARDKPARAELELQGALSTWPPGAFHLQHFWALFATCERLLYEGDPEEAQRVMDQGVRPLKRSLLTRIQMVRAEATELQGRIALALAAAAADQRSRDAMTARARQFGRSLSREGPGFTTAWGALILAGADFLAGDESPEVLDAAIEGLTEARCHLYAAAARRRRGELTEGEPGRALIAQTDSWMIEKGIVHPARMTGMLTPAYRGLRGRMG